MFKNIALFFVAVSLFACDEKKPAPPPPLLKVNMIEKKAENCVRDSVCATLSLQYPILSDGDNTTAMNAINDSLRLLALAGLEANPKLSVEQAFDSARINIYFMLQEQMKMMQDWAGGFFKEVKTNTLLNNPKYISFEVSASGYTGGAHPYYSSTLVTYDLNTGKSVALKEIVSDTAALRPMLEQGFLNAKKEGMPDSTRLSDLLFAEVKQLPVSDNTCVVPEGLRFLYNPYEVSPWAVGATEITLTWQQLGRLADRKKWLE
jgi:hypothetical protein